MIAVDPLVLASTACKLQQCSACKDIDPDSWAWIWSGCWLIGAAPLLGIGLFMAAYVGIQIWSRRGTQP